MNDNEYHPYYTHHYYLEGCGWPDGNKIRKRRKHRARTRANSKKPRGRQKLLRLLKLQNYICFYCGQPITTENANIDHVTPRSEGGTNIHSNLVAAHITCNTQKGNKLPTPEQLQKLSILHLEFNTKYQQATQHIEKQTRWPD